MLHELPLLMTPLMLRFLCVLSRKSVLKGGIIIVALSSIFVWCTIFCVIRQRVCYYVVIVSVHGIFCVGFPF